MHLAGWVGHLQSDHESDYTSLIHPVVLKEARSKQAFGQSLYLIPLVQRKSRKWSHS